MITEGQHVSTSAATSSCLQTKLRKFINKNDRLKCLFGSLEERLALELYSELGTVTSWRIVGGGYFLFSLTALVDSSTVKHAPPMYILS